MLGQQNIGKCTIRDAALVGRVAYVVTIIWGAKVFHFYMNYKALLFHYYYTFAIMPMLLYLCYYAYTYATMLWYYTYATTITIT